MKKSALLLSATASVFLLAGAALAQQPAPEGQRHDDDIPTLTTEDVQPVEGQPAGAQTEAPPPDGQDAELTPEEQADAAAAKQGDAGEKQSGKKGPSKAELAWRQRYSEAKSAVAAAEKRAQEAELRLTDLRNDLATTSTTGGRNAVAAQIEQQGDVVRQAKADVASARERLERVTAEGQRQRFSPDPGPSRTTKSGAPNPAFYAQAITSAQNAYDDATRRIELYQNQVNDVRQRILNNAGSGDNFTQLKLQQELDSALQQLEKAKSDQITAQQKLENAKTAARNAGIPVRP